MAGRIPGPVRTLQRSWACRRAAVSGTVVKKAGLPAVFEELFSSLCVVAAELVSVGRGRHSSRCSLELDRPSSFVRVENGSSAGRLGGGRLLRAGVLIRIATHVSSAAGLAAGAEMLQQVGEGGLARARFACATGEPRSRHGAA